MPGTSTAHEAPSVAACPGTVKMQDGKREMAAGECIFSSFHEKS